MIRHTYTVKVVKVDGEDVGAIIDAISRAGWSAEIEQDGTWDDGT